MSTAVKLFLMSLLAAGCGAELTPGDEDADESPPPITEAVYGEASLSCASHGATGYKSGQSFEITLVSADGKPVELKTASAYHQMEVAAAKAGVTLTVVSGFRTMAEQQYLYACYVHCSCNSCNLAAKPGYSNHQSGHALDLNTSNPGVYGWLTNHAASFGFHRTVPSEIWHWEYWGPLVPNPCTGGGGGTSDGPDCYSHTLARDVKAGACVQSASDAKWYHCENGGWHDGQVACTVSYGFCHSATLNRNVPPRTCVQSRSDHVWYQCNHDGWDTPVHDGAGPVGTCSAEYAL
jgi:predicted cupin superfamily sugar epimerase